LPGGRNRRHLAQADRSSPYADNDDDNDDDDDDDDDDYDDDDDDDAPPPSRPSGACDLFVHLRPYFIPDDDKPPADNLQAARADIRHLAPFLVRVAARSSTPPDAASCRHPPAVVPRTPQQPQRHASDLCHAAPDLGTIHSVADRALREARARRMLQHSEQSACGSAPPAPRAPDTPLRPQTLALSLAKDLCVAQTEVADSVLAPSCEDSGVLETVGLPTTVPEAPQHRANVYHIVVASKAVLGELEAVLDERARQLEPCSNLPLQTVAPWLRRRVHRGRRERPAAAPRCTACGGLRRGLAVRPPSSFAVAASIGRCGLPSFARPSPGRVDRTLRPTIVSRAIHPVGSARTVSHAAPACTFG